MPKILITESDQNQLHSINRLLGSARPDWRGYCAAYAEEALSLAKTHLMDIVVVDLDLPGGRGLSLARQIREIPDCEFIWMILLSWDSWLEKEAYRTTRCYDFIIKPYRAEALADQLGKLARYKTICVKEADPDPDFVTFKQRDLITKVPARDILYIEVSGNNTTLHTRARSFYVSKMSLRRLKPHLPRYFVQCHKSYLVNRNYIESLEKGRFGWEIRLKDCQTLVPNGKKYQEEISRTIANCGYNATICSP